MLQAMLWAAGGTGFTFLMTALGAATVFLVRRTMDDRLQKVCFGFAAGVMIAASIWSMLIPAIEDAQAMNDSAQNAKELASKLKGMLCHVNLIPVNDVKERNFVRSCASVSALRECDRPAPHPPQWSSQRSMGSHSHSLCQTIRKSADGRTPRSPSMPPAVYQIQYHRGTRCASHPKH